MKKISIKNMKNKTFFTKKIMSLSSLSTLVTIVPLSVGVCQIVLNNSKYSYNNQTFNSYNDLQNYVTSQAKVQNVEQSSNWSITQNGVTKTYSSPEELRNDIYKNYINTNLSLSSSKSSYSLSSTNLQSNNSSLTNIYQGNNDVAYDNADQAYKTYFNAKNGYYFNNVYFSSKDDLNKYLVSNYLPSAKNQTNSIILKSPSGVESSSIDLSSKDAYNKIQSFITKYSENTLSYTNSTTQKSLSITKSNINNSSVSNVSLRDLDYLHVQSNQGESRYIVDNASTDDNNLIGPYFYDGVLDTGSFTNKKMWKKVSGVKSQVYAQSKIDISIGSFFTSIINDDNALNLSQAQATKTDPLLFRTLLTDKDGNSYDQWFLTELGKLSPKLKAAVVEANTTMMSGKKYNSFYKLSILYNFLLSRIVSWGLGQDVMNLVVDYFTNVSNFIQNAIEFVALYNKDLLKSKDGKTIFNVKDFFEIGNPEYNFNSSTEYFLNKLKTNYPNLVALISVYVGAQNNITMTGGLIPFKSFDVSYLFDFGIFDNQKTYYDLEKYLEPVYNTFSALNIKDMAKAYVLGTSRSDIKDLSSLSGDDLIKALEKVMIVSGSDISIEMMLSSIGAKNSEYYKLASSLIKLELNTYLETGAIATGGYLDQLYSKNSSNDKLGLFVNFVMDDSMNSDDISLYRVYLAFMIDKKAANNQFINPTTTKNVLSFVQALTRLISFTLYSTSLTASTISRIYNHNTNLNPNIEDPVVPQANDNALMNQFMEDVLTLPNNTITNSSSANNSNNSASSKKIRTSSSVIEVDSPSNSGSIDSANKGTTSSGNSNSTEGSSNSNGTTGGNSSSSTNGGRKPKKVIGHTLHTKKAYQNKKLRKATSSTKPKLFSPDVNTSSTDVPDKKVWYISFEDFLQNKLTDAEGAKDFYSDIKDAKKFKSIARNANGELTLLNPLDDAMVSTSSDFNQLSELESQFTSNSGNADSGSISGGTTGGSSSGSSSGNGNSSGGSSSGSNNGSGSTSGGTTGGGNSSGSSSGNGNGSGSGTGSGSTEGGSVGGNSGSNSGSSNGGSNSSGGTNSSTELRPESVKRPEVEDFKKQKKSWWSGSFSSFDKIKNTISTIATTVLSTFTAAFMALEIFFFMYNLFSVSSSQDFYLYTTSDGTEFIWDGGVTISQFLGLKNTTKVGIDSMKLLNPIQITLPQVEEFYYFNGVKYYDNTEELKRNELIYILNGGKVINKNFKQNLTFSSNGYDESTSIEELITKVITSLGITKNEDGSFDASKLNENSAYLSSINLKNYGSSSISSDNYATLAKSISDNIRPTLIVKLPDLTSSFASGDTSNDFVFPGNYWDGNKVVTPSDTNFSMYLVDNSANDLIDESKSYVSKSNFKVTDDNKAIQAAEEALFNTFKSSFNLNTKKILKNDLTLSNKYSDLKGVEVNKVYSVNLNGISKTFNSLNDATNYVLNSLNFTKNSTYKDIYVYGNRTYNSITEMMRDVMKNCRVIN